MARNFRDLAKPGADGDTLMIDSTPLKAHRTAASLGEGSSTRAIGRTKGGLNSKLHMVGDGKGPPADLLVARPDERCPRWLVLLAQLPPAKRLPGDKGCEADRLRDELKSRGLRVCIPARTKRRHPASHNRKLHKTRCRVENAFACLTNRRGIAMRHAPCGHLFLSATALAASAIFWPP